MEAPPAQLESRLDSLAKAVARLEARVAILEAEQPQRLLLPRGLGQEGSVPLEDLPNPGRVMGLIGRVCLTLGGATFIRALVDAGTIYRGWGVALGLVYAITWAFFADRAKSRADAASHALASILIAYPLLVESTARFGILDPVLAAPLLLAVTGLHGAVAWRRDLQPILWIAALASLGSGFAMMAARQSIEPFLGVFFVLGMGALWFTDDPRWRGLRWPTAFAADLGVLVLTTLLAWPGGTPEAYRGIPPGRAMAFALALPTLYVGGFLLRMHRRGGAAKGFERVQTALALILGLGGALRIALASGSGTGALGVGIAVAGLACYAAAAPFAEGQEEARANFHFFTFLALGLLLLGPLVVLPRPLAAHLAGALGLGAMWVGLRLRRAVLLLQSGIYLAAAALASGLAAWSFRAFLDPAGPRTSLGPSGLLVLGTLAAALALFLVKRPPDAITARVRPVILAMGIQAAGSLGALAIWGCCGLLSTGAQDAGLLAVVRTGVLSGLAVVLAWCGRRMPALELRWLVYPLLVAAALKFLFEDLAVGRPLTLFIGFMCIGATLMLAPRLLKSA